MNSYNMIDRAEALPPGRVPSAGDQVPGFNLPPLLLQYWHAAIRWRWLAIGIVLSVLAAGLIATMLAAPKYTARAQIEISRQQKQVTNVAGVESQEAGRDLEFYQTQYSLLVARPVAERVAAELNLANSDAFFAAHGLSREKIARKGGTNAPAVLQKSTVDLLLRNVDIVPIRTSRLVNIAYTSRSPQLSADIANRWASAFILISVDRQFASTADARRVLEQRLVELRQRLEESERKAVLYASRTGIVSLDQARDGGGRSVTSRTLAGSTLEELASALNQSTALRIAAEAKLTQRGDATTEAIGNATLANLRQKRAEIAADYAKVLVTFEPNYPGVKELREQLASIDKAIAQETGRISSVRGQEYAEATKRENQLRAKVDSTRALLDQQNRSNIQFAIYQRDADTNRQLYDALLQRYKEIGIAGTIAPNNIAIVDPAIVPEKPSSPRLMMNMLFALLGGFALAAAAVFAVEHIDEGIRDPGRIEALLGLPLLGGTPTVEGSIADLIRDPKSALIDSVFSIRSSLAFATNHGFPRSLAVISTAPNEGKSSTALALAAVLARTGKRVLLVDADLRSPSLHTMASVTNERGFSNFLAGEDDWPPLVKATQFDGLSVMTTGPIPPSAAELLSGDRLGRFMKESLDRFDHIIVDSPPVLGLTDAQLIGTCVEGVVYVVQAAGAAARAIRASVARMRAVDAHLFGVVLTKLTRDTSGYGYGYAYGYGYGYGKRYGAESKA